MLYEFKGVLNLKGVDQVVLTEDSLLLRGARLKNTTWIHGIVVYSGSDTKLILNSMRPPLKRSTMDRMTNNQVDQKLYRSLM